MSQGPTAYVEPELVFLSTNIAGASFADKVAAARAGGFPSITLWWTDVLEAKASGMEYADMRRLLSDNGVQVAGVDCLLNWLPGENVPDHPMFSTTEAQMYEMASEFEARWMNLAQLFGNTISEAEATDAFARVCERGAEYGLKVSLEPLPWSGISDVAIAYAIVKGSGADNARIAVDFWHFYRGANDLDQLRAVPVEYFDNIQINDAFAEPVGELMADTANRQLPGEGDGPLVPFLDVLLNEKGYRGPVGIEAPSKALSDLPPEEAGRRCGETTRSVLAQASLLAR